MRWNDLFADLDAQLESAQAAEQWAEVVDRSRREFAGLSLLDRASAHLGANLLLGVVGTTPVGGRLVDLTQEWLLIEEPPGREVLVPVQACSWLLGLGRAAQVQPARSLTRRLGLGSALRSLARQRIQVQMLLLCGSSLTGTIDRAGAEHQQRQRRTNDESAG